jgi:hypothetical protein
MTSKNQAAKLKKEARSLRRKLKMQMRRYSPFDDRYLRLDRLLAKAERRWQRRRDAERAK